MARATMASALISSVVENLYMNVVLDTNIIVQDFLLQSKKFNLLLDHLKKTSSRVIMPQIVYEEVAEVYRRRLAQHLEDYKETGKKLEIVLAENRNVPKVDIQVDEEVEKYREYLKEKLSFSSSNIVPYKEIYLGELVNRAVKRLRPFSSKGEEFRDALLWLTVLDIAKAEEHQAIVFISNNPKEFGPNHTLHTPLHDEVKDRSLTVKYYNSIEHFIQRYAIQVEYITLDWLIDQLNIELVEEKLAESIKDYLLNMNIDRFRRGAWEELEFSGYINFHSNSLDKQNLDKPFIYEKMDGSLYVEVNYYHEIEVEAFAREESNSYTSSSFHSDLVESISHEGYYSKGIRYLYPEIEITFSITVVDQRVVNVQIVNWSNTSMRY